MNLTESAWFKPILLLIVAVVIYLLVQFVLWIVSKVKKGYEEDHWTDADDALLEEEYEEEKITRRKKRIKAAYEAEEHEARQELLHLLLNQIEEFQKELVFFTERKTMPLDQYLEDFKEAKQKFIREKDFFETEEKNVLFYLIEQVKECKKLVQKIHRKQRELYDEYHLYESLLFFQCQLEELTEMNANYGALVLRHQGHKEMEKIFAMHPHSMTVFSDVQLKYQEGESSHYDFILLSRKGIFPIEVKNYGVKPDVELQIEITTDGQYILRKGDRKVKDRMDLLSQVNEHIASLEEAFYSQLEQDDAHLLSKIEIFPIVVVTNDDVEIRNDYRKLPIIRRNALYHEINVHRIIYNDTELEVLRQTIENSMVPQGEREHVTFKANLMEMAGILRNYQRLLERIVKRC